jgi:hypothetical protein
VHYVEKHTARWKTILLKANILFPLDRNGSLNHAIESIIPVKMSNPCGNNVAIITSSFLIFFILSSIITMIMESLI